MLISIGSFVVRRGRTPVAGPISIEIRSGDILALVGRNGSGKSSFLSGLAGVLPNAGALIFNGRDLSVATPRERLLAGLALCPSGRHLFADLSVRDNVLLGGYTAGRDEAARRLKSLAQMDHFRILRERPEQRAGTLSGGQQQIVALARALMSRPRLLLLDEPTAGLAPNARGNVVDVIRNFVGADGHAVIVAEENLDFACSIATRIAAFQGGALLFESDNEGLTAADILQKLLDGESRSRITAGERHAN